MARNCPAKHFENLNPGIAVEAILDYPTTLPAPHGKALLADAKADLDACEAGASCVNIAYIKAAGRLNMTEDLARHVCKLPYRCTAPFECEVE